jgi:hypothetical protein
MEFNAPEVEPCFFTIVAQRMMMMIDGEVGSYIAADPIAIR